MNRRLSIYILLGFITAIAVFLKVSWKKWFRNQPETSYVYQFNPTRILQVPGDEISERIITWVCDTVVLPSQLEMAVGNDTITLEAHGRVVNSRAGKSAFYKVNMPGLPMGQTVSYRVMTDGRISDWYSFNTITGIDSLSFTIIGDIQDTLRGISGEVMQTIFNQAKKTDFISFVGDVIERPMDCYWNHWVEGMGDILPSNPIVITPGNHEYLKAWNPVLEDRWKASLPFPANGPAGFEGSTYVITHPLMDMISIDTQGIKGLFSLMRTRSWLKQQLQQNQDKWKVVLMHHPIYSPKKGRDNVFIRWAFLPLFEKYNVALVIQGHDHSYMRRNTAGDDNQQNMAPVYLVTTTSHKSYVPKVMSSGNMLEKYIYQDVALNKESITVNSYFATGKLMDSFTILRNGTVVK